MGEEGRNVGCMWVSEEEAVMVWMGGGGKMSEGVGEKRLAGSMNVMEI